MQCPICNQTEQFTALSPELCSTNNQMCQKCGLVFIPERDDSIKDYYAADGYFKKSPNIALREQFISKGLLVSLAKDRLAKMSALFHINFQAKRVLDVGCGYGELLYVLQNSVNAQVLGLEPSDSAVSIGTKYFTIPIEKTVLESYTTQELFDVILTCHTLEHTVDPRAFLTRLRELLVDDGLCYIEVPNVLKPTGNFPLATFLYNEHLQTFSASNLCRLVNACNLSIVAYDDKDFLRILCKKTAEVKNDSFPPEIASKDVLQFLKDYNKTYSLLDLAGVYLHKVKYLLRIIKYAVLSYVN